MATEETLSLQLYDYLCEVVGSEKTVSARRLWFKVHDDRNNTIAKDIPDNPFFMVSSGSRAEGLDFKGSDLDVMFVLDTMVYNHTNSPKNYHILCYDMESVQPGFFRIKICPTQINGGLPNEFIKFGKYANLFSKAAIFTENGILVSCDKIKQHFQSEPIGRLKLTFSGAHKIHGPCVSVVDDSLDMALSLPCPHWPSQASAWITRHRFSGWPTAEILSTIVHAGILFVPVGTLNAWRISFSVGEKLLIHSFNHTQLLCYALLKFVLKEVIEDVPDLQNLLCSYFMKTVIFWLLEETDVKDWKPQRLLPCFQQCLKRLIYFVNCGYCPNYFMPDNNMFQHKIYGKYQMKLYSFLSDLYNGGMLYVVLCCNSLFGFHNNMTFRTNIDDTDRGIYPLMIPFNVYGPLQISVISASQILKRLYFLKQFVPKLVIDLYLIELALTIGKAVHHDIYDYGMCNRQLHIAYQIYRHHLLIAAACDNVRGWLYLALFFYGHRQLDHALVIIDFILSECTNDKIYFNGDEKLKKWKLSDNVKSLSFAKRLKLKCVHDIINVGCVTTETFTLPLLKEISFDQGNATMLCNAFVQGSPEVIGLVKTELLKATTLMSKHFPFAVSTFLLAQFIRCMCHHHLHNHVESQCSVYDLKYAVERYSAHNSAMHIASYALLESAIEISGFKIDTKQLAQRIGRELGENFRTSVLCIKKNNKIPKFKDF